MPSRYIEVAVPLPVTGTFTYSIPDRIGEAPAAGARVLVPFGRRKLTGFVVGHAETSPVRDMKEILEVLDAEPMLDERMLELGRWIAEYYIASLGEVLRAMLPPGINMESRRVAAITPEGREALAAGALPERRAGILEMLDDRGSASVAAVRREKGLPAGRLGDLDALAREGLIEIREEVRRPRATSVTEPVISLAGTREQALEDAGRIERRAPRQAAALRALAEAEDEETSLSDLTEAGVRSDAVARLVAKGLVVRSERERRRLSTGFEGWETAEEGPPTPEQERALGVIRARLDSDEPGVVLLHGVTGSGKTRVYSEAIRIALGLGRGAIVLVPEIALTPQMVQRMREDFEDRVAVIHSGLSLAERYDTWRAVRAGDFSVVVGPRSAVFAPVADLGVIVVDEEHEHTYKQAESPRYHARDVAVMRGRLEGAVVVLGTATPSMESYRNATEGKYELIELPERIDAGPLPEVEIVDMRETPTIDSEGTFSAALRDAVAGTLEAGKQTILFLNRRGYASFVQCLDCGHSERCSTCNVSLTFHTSDRSMRCHYCGARKTAPDRCPACGSRNLRYGAPGTQRVEKAVAELFPEARVARMDQDTTRRHGSHWRILKAFAERRTDILLGTQMIAKGLDFPGVGLVGVVAADVGLNLPDFRSGERTFQLLTQVAGRTGRGMERGKVVIQSYLPDHYTIALAREQRYTPFFEREVDERRAIGLGYPPFSRLVSILVRGKEPRHVTDAASRLAEFLERGAAGMPEPRPEVLGPAPAPLERIKGAYRWQVVVRGMGGTARALVAGALRQREALRLPGGVAIAVDVDPLDLL